MVTGATIHTDCGHEVELAGAWAGSNGAGPSLVERNDEDFLAAMLQELAGANPASVVSDHRPTAGDGNVLQLFQPVHRTFNLALIEAHCTSFGTPRLDPRQIDSAGLVVRRVRSDKSGKIYDAWCATKNRVTGWVPLPDVSEPEHDRDPDPARRPRTRITADPDFDRETFGAGDQSAEQTSLLFVAPPDTAAATKRTLLYGVIPVTSTSRAGAMPKGDTPKKSEWTAHLSVLLSAASFGRELWPADTDGERADKLSRDDLRQPAVLNADGTINTNRTRFVLLVRQLAQEFSLLRPANAETRDALLKVLDGVDLLRVDGTKQKLGQYLHSAARLYFEQPPPAGLSVPRPQTWPAIAPDTAEQIAQRLQQIAGEVMLSTFATDKAGGRFEDPTARYVVRAFVRVKQPCNCPPKIVWTHYSEEFRIVPWYESGPVPPPPVLLPDPFDPNFLKNAKPGVSFTVPASLANFLNQDPKSFLKGEAGKGGGLTLDWICGFNIPIITICAFIVLNVFLNLFNLIFFWLPFVKICIPFPRKK